MTTTTIESTVVKLDGLHAAYKEVLDQAKQQLEDVDLTPVIINALAARLKDDSRLCHDCGRAAAHKIKEDIKSEESEILDTYAGKGLCEAVADRMFEAIKGRIDAYIKEKVLNVIETAQIERLLQEKVLENGTIHEALIIRRKLKELLHALPEEQSK